MTLEQLVDDVLLDVPGVPRAIVQSMIFWAVRELCQEADVWVIEGPVVYAADSDVPVISSSEGEPLRLLSLQLGGRSVVQGDWYTQDAPDRVTFHRKPGASVIEGRLAVQPRPDEEPPSEVLAAYSETIRHGACYRLLRLPQPWRDFDLAHDYERRFRAGISEARQLSRLGHGRGGARVKMRRFV